MYFRPQKLESESRRNPEEPTTPDAAKAAPDALASTDYWDWCPRCSHRLESMKCKYVCRRCGYYMSCADFD